MTVTVKHVSTLTVVQTEEKGLVTSHNQKGNLCFVKFHKHVWTNTTESQIETGTTVYVRHHTSGNDTSYSSNQVC